MKEHMLIFTVLEKQKFERRGDKKNNNNNSVRVAHP